MANSPSPTTDISVNEHEGAVLSLIARTQAVTRYQLLKAFEQSPTTSYNSSKGSLYPLIGRMLDRGFLVARPSENRRGSEVLSLTPLGRAALRNWILWTDPQHSFTHDPFLSRVMALGDITRDERARWIADARAILLGKRRELADFREAANVPYFDIVHGTAIAIVDAKLEWLDRLLIEIAGETKMKVEKPPT